MITSGQGHCWLGEKSGNENDRDWEALLRKVRGSPLASELEITTTLLPAVCVCVFMCNEQSTKSTSVYSRSGNETLHPLAATPTSIHAEVGNFHYPACVSEETQRCFRLMSGNRQRTIYSSAKAPETNSWGNFYLKEIIS